jgi:predicted metal-binding membrane protein
VNTRGQRLVIYGGLAGITLVAWAYLVYLATSMQATNMSMDISMPSMQAWGIADTSLTFVMWVVMMVAMMTPSAVPVIDMYRSVSQMQHKEKAYLSSTWLFILGYLLTWAGFSGAATLGQWGLHSAALLTPMLASASPLLGGALLVAAGIYQFTPLKNACLSHCRTPIGFLLAEWRDGKLGPLMMGMRHGLYCVGCCWLLMALLFVGGVMNLVWVALVAAYVLVEKVSPARMWLSRISGIAVISWGLWLLAGPIFATFHHSF